ncbi:hypothetical protein [Haloferula sp. BvORR071]|uniref:hypothetical protein n=1 Tax=Haloferula sp. BvORR071 TaxID=1396141 RepID=UPI00054E3024|nr:hypothetical protein [Haloferula sp. BvORR071]
MPLEVKDALSWIIGALVVGFLAGTLFAWLVASLRRTRLEERLKAAERQNTELAARHAEASSEAGQHEANAQALRTQLAELRVRVEEGSRSLSEKQELLTQAEQRRVSLETLLKPVAETIGKFDGRLGDMEKARGAAHAEMQAQLQILAALAGQLGELGYSLEQARDGALPAISAVSAFGEDFGFVPDPQQQASSAASDLRSALEG